MTKPSYRELATNFTLWCRFVVFENQVSEREFDEMSINEKLDILQGCFGSEIRALSTPRRDLNAAIARLGAEIAQLELRTAMGRSKTANH